MFYAVYYARDLGENNVYDAGTKIQRTQGLVCVCCVTPRALSGRLLLCIGITV